VDWRTVINDILKEVPELSEPPVRRRFRWRDRGVSLPLTREDLGLKRPRRIAEEET
jgi:hypothetical protein